MAKRTQNKKWHTAASALLWVLVWQLAALAIGEELFLHSPVAVVRSFAGLALTGGFWASAGTSLLRIGLGFVLGLVLGVLLAWGAAAFRFVETLLRPLMLLVRSTPVASFVILALVWVSGRSLSTFISFLMVLPVIYNGTLSGIAAADGKLLEMAEVFHVSFGRRVRAIYLPALRPFLLSACELALGLCWKSGVAAEVIGLPKGTIGERLYQAKIYLMTPELFAWTAVIILLSWLFTKLVMAGLRGASRKLERSGLHG